MSQTTMSQLSPLVPETQHQPLTRPPIQTTDVSNVQDLPVPEIENPTEVTSYGPVQGLHQIQNENTFRAPPPDNNVPSVNDLPVLNIEDLTEAALFGLTQAQPQIQIGNAFRHPTPVANAPSVDDLAVLDVEDLTEAVLFRPAQGQPRIEKDNTFRPAPPAANACSVNDLPMANPAEAISSRPPQAQPFIQNISNFPAQAQQYQASFLQGNTLMFSKFKIKLDPASGHDFQGCIPPAEPKVVPKKTWSHPVGIVVDGYASLLDIEMSDILNGVYDANYEVSMCLVDYAPGWELVDSLERPIDWREIRFDPQFNSVEKLLGLFEIMRKHRDNWDSQQAFEYSHRMRWWRQDRRNWEINVLRHEWDRGNTVIFPPGTTEEDINDAIMDLRQQEASDWAGVLPSAG